MRASLLSAPRIIVIILTVCLLSACGTNRRHSAGLKQKLAPAPLQDEVELLYRILQANHPGLYLYTSKDSLDVAFSHTAANITDSLTIPEYRNRLAGVISLIKCGHTAVRFPERYGQFLLNRHLYTRFPLSIKTWGDSMVVIGNLVRQDTIFKRGTIITGINGLSRHQLLDSMFKLIGTDGNANNFKSQLISFNFGAHYQNTFGTDSIYRIRYINSSGGESEAVLPHYRPVRDTSLRQQRPPAPLAPPLTRKERRKASLAGKRSLSIDTALSTAHMRVATFSGGQLRSFFRRSFKQLHKDSIQNLIIDLRENGGGSIAVSNRFTRYITDHPFKVADTIAAVSRRLRYSKYIHPSWVYWLTMQLTSRKKKDGLYHFGMYERHTFRPDKRHAFNGQVYILQGGFTFSAASMFIAHVKGQHNVLLAGEETGGGAYGNNSVHLPVIKLPYSGMQVVLPLYRVVMDPSALSRGRGIQPDLVIPPSSDAIRRGVDQKLETIKMLIKQGVHPAPPSAPENRP